MKKIVNFSLTFFTFILILFFGSCEKEDDYSTDEITAEINSITPYSASVFGYDNGRTVIEHGVCWNTSGNPTTNDFKLECEIHKYDDLFFGELTNLTPNTQYFVRPYIIWGKKKKTSYGKEVSFTTIDPSSVILPPSITISVPESSITSTSATVMSTAKNVGNLNEVGIRYSSEVMPDFSNPDTSIQIKCKYNTDGSFSAELTNLTPSTTYYIISYSLNEMGLFTSIMLTIKTK